MLRRIPMDHRGNLRDLVPDPVVSKDSIVGCEGWIAGPWSAAPVSGYERGMKMPNV